jgi:hypothetical protein
MGIETSENGDIPHFLFLIMLQRYTQFVSIVYTSKNISKRELYLIKELKEACRQTMILPKKRDLRFITVRRGGTLQDADHHLLAIWAADCAQYVLHLFEDMQPNDNRPRQAIELVRAWARGEITMMQARNLCGLEESVQF